LRSLTLSRAAWTGKVRPNDLPLDFGVDFRFRRPGFLHGCPADVYLQIFTYLIRYDRRVPSDYYTLHHAIKVGEYMDLLCGHILFWANPGWVEPYKTSKDAKTAFYEYENLLRHAYTYQPTYRDGGTDEDDVYNNELDRNQRERVQKFLDELRRLVSKNFQAFSKICKEVRSLKRAFISQANWSLGCKYVWQSQSKVLLRGGHSDATHVSNAVHPTCAVV
jgi:hypothetical protein